MSISISLHHSRSLSCSHAPTLPHDHRPSLLANSTIINLTPENPPPDHHARLKPPRSPQRRVPSSLDKRTPCPFSSPYAEEAGVDLTQEE